MSPIQFIFHVIILVVVVRVEMMLYRIQRMGDDVALVETLLKIWATGADAPPELKSKLLAAIAERQALEQKEDRS